MGTSRFLSVSSELSLSALLRVAHRTLWVGLGMALLAHVMLTRVSGPTGQAVRAKPLTTRFVKRAPRLAKPLELKKRPQPRRRSLRRTVVLAEARASRQTLSSRALWAEVVQGVAKPRVFIGRSVSVAHAAAEPQEVAQAVVGAKEARDVRDMSLELVNIEALDTGQYRAMIIEDPTDKRNIRGYLHLAHAYPKAIANSGARQETAHRIMGFVAVRGLIQAMNDYTQIRTDLIGRYPFDSEELLKIPFVLTSAGGYAFDHSTSEAANLGLYMIVGGFYFADCRHPSLGPERASGRSFRHFIKAGMEAQGLHLGRDWSWDKVPNSHPVYHCYFDFDGPPPGVDNLSGGWGYEPMRYLEGVFWQGRLAAILSLKAYTAIWRKDKSSSWVGDSTRQRQFGVNLIIYALTHEKSTTKQAMDTIAH